MDCRWVPVRSQILKSFVSLVLQYSIYARERTKSQLHLVNITTKTTEQVRKWTIVFRSRILDKNIDQSNAGEKKLVVPMNRQEKKNANK